MKLAERDYKDQQSFNDCIYSEPLVLLTLQLLEYRRSESPMLTGLKESGIFVFVWIVDSGIYVLSGQYFASRYSRLNVEYINLCEATNFIEIRHKNFRAEHSPALPASISEFV